MRDGKPVVLVIDDEQLNRRLIEAMLVPMGYSVVLAENGREGLETARRVDPDVILLDVMMPEMDGFDVAARLKSEESTAVIPLVMVTALRDVEDRVRALDLGADDFLTKPVDKLELRARVKSLVKVKSYNDYLRNYQRRLKEEVDLKTVELRNAFERIKVASLDTIYRLSRAAVFKDEGTGSHINRMSHYAAVVARSLGLDEIMVESLIYAMPMHDVGKIGIPDRILLKPGKLDPDEWQLMKEHTTIGARILEGSDVGFMKLAEVIALTHHEKWNGSGYPQGLSGEQIPLVGRIAAVVDVFDALLSARPYKEAFTVEEALRIIRRDTGAHFDPSVVDAFMRAMNEILIIRDRYCDNEADELFRMSEQVRNSMNT